MAEELGKIEKPPIDNFAGSRKLILVPLVFSGRDAPADFMEIFNRCWDQVGEQIEGLENKLGKANSLYHEMIFSEDEEGLKALEQLSPASFAIIKRKREAGASLQAVEDAELAMENMDWERCLMVAMGQKVRSKVIEFHMESSAKRYQHMGQKIDETLKEGEIGLVFVREGHPIQFPQTIEVFNVYPPALDEINRWLRDFPKRVVVQESES